jgi:hypothetical protein
MSRSRSVDIRRAVPLAFLAITSLLAAPAAEAARLPDWAKPIAESAPPAPEGVPPYPSRVLFSETRYEVQTDGTMKIRRRYATQALSSRAEGVGVGWFPFEETMRMTSSKAWHVAPGEKASRSWGPPVDVAVGDAFLSGSKARLVQVRDIRKGSLVFYEFEATDAPRFLSLRQYFFEGSPVVDDRFEVVTPPGWAVAWAWLREKGPDPVVSGDTRTWEMRDLPEMEAEPLGREPIDRAPLLVVNIVPPEGARSGAAAFRDWASFSAWYEEIIKGRSDPTPGVDAAVKKVISDPAGGGFFDKVKAAGTFVRDKVRYVDVELGLGAMQPRPASDTLSNLYGDCKDKGTLFRSFLGEEGIRSYPVLINSSLDETVSEKVPAWGFNHFVVAVPVPAGETVPPSFAPAIVEAGDLGRLLIVDTTDEKTAIGSLSSNLGGKRGLLVAGERGKVIDLPSGDPSVHRMVRRLTMEVRPDRSVAVVRETRYTGDFAANARARYSSSSVERRKGVEERVLQIWPDATVEGYQAEYETPQGAYVETVTFKLRPLPASGSGARIEIFPGAAEDLDRVPLGRRKAGVDYGHAQTLRYEVSVKGVPESSQLPAPQSARGDGWEVATTYARDGGTVRATWEVILSRARFEPDAFAELKKLWSSMASAASWVIDLPA